MCTAFLVNETLSTGRGRGITSGVFSWPPFIREGYTSAGRSIFVLFLRRLWIALDANSHAVLKQCVASNRYARKICENFSKCLSWGIPLERVRSCRKLLCFHKWYWRTDMQTELCPEIQPYKKVQTMLWVKSILDQNGSFHKEIFQFNPSAHDESLILLPLKWHRQPLILLVYQFI